LLFGFIVDGTKQFFGVDRLNQVWTQSKQVAHLVGLEVSDEMPTYILGQNGHFFGQFLHAALPEISFACMVSFTDSFNGMKLADTHQINFWWYVLANVSYAFSD